MGRPLRESKAPTTLVPLLLTFAERRGASRVELSARLGVAWDGAADEVTVTPATLRGLFEAVADVTGEPSLGLRLASEQAPSPRYAPVELAVRATATLRAALECLARYAPLVHPHLSAAVVVEGESARWTHATPGQPRAVGPHAEDYALAFVLARCREVCRSHEDPIAVRFTHARPRDLAPLHRFFGTRDLSFGRETSELLFAASALDLPVESHDVRLLTTALDLADGALARQSTARRTASTVATALPALLPDRATIDAVAHELALSVRTLQRRLDEEGTTFLEVLDSVREEIARQELQRGDAPLVDLAERLGFSDLATFSRAFKRWTGQPPGLFRRRLRLV